MRLAVILIMSLITTEALSKDFSFKTSYFFTQIEAECASGTCEVTANGKSVGSYPYHMEGNIAIANVKGLNVYYNTLTKELKY